MHWKDRVSFIMLRLSFIAAQTGGNAQFKLQSDANSPPVSYNPQHVDINADPCIISSSGGSCCCCSTVTVYFSVSSPQMPLSSACPSGFSNQAGGQLVLMLGLSLSLL